MLVTGIIGVSGGSGASTTSAYVTRMLSMNKKRVLVVDLNVLSDATKLLAPKTKTINENLFDDNNYIIEHCISSSQYKNVSIISAFGDKVKYYNQIENKLINNDFFGELVSFARDYFDHVIIDYSAVYSPALQNCLRVCDKVIGVMNSQPHSISKAVSFLEILAQSRIDNPLNFVKLILNNVDSKNLAHQLAMKQYSKFIDVQLKLPFFINQIKYTTMGNKISKQLPAKAYNKLANFIAKEIEK